MAETYQPLPQGADRAQLLAHALRWGVGGLDGAQLRTLDQTALVAVQGYPKDLEPHQARVLENLSQLRHRIASEQQRRRVKWAQLTSQLAAMDDDAQAQAQGAALDQDAPGAALESLTTEERAARLLRAALVLLMDQDGRQGPGRPGQGPNGNGGGGRPVRPIRPGPTTPPQDGRALTVPGRPSSTRRGDDDGPDF